ncbi:hypothetical protein [Roseobacter sp.]|uniref:hypothetical protein n=1 Tax=Roseobacter sp. TaxID=1907202 RepID=UPI0032967D03
MTRNAHIRLAPAPAKDTPTFDVIDKSDALKGEIHPGSPEHRERLSRIQEALATVAWMESPEGIAEQAAQLAKQNARPVPPAIYRNDQVVGFASEGGFTSTNAMANYTPDGWTSLSVGDLKQTLNAQFRQTGQHYAPSRPPMRVWTSRPVR